MKLYILKDKLLEKLIFISLDFLITTKSVKSKRVRD